MQALHDILLQLAGALTLTHPEVKSKIDRRQVKFRIEPRNSMGKCPVFPASSGKMGVILGRETPVSRSPTRSMPGA
jgi:hypothetical protein